METGRKYYCRNAGVGLSGAPKNPLLFRSDGTTVLLPQASLNRLKVGNCAEVDAVSQALNDGAHISNLRWSIWTKAPSGTNGPSKVVEVLPECLFEFPTFEQSDFDHLDKASYNTMVSLLKDLDDRTDALLEGILDMEEAYAYTVIDGVRLRYRITLPVWCCSSRSIVPSRSCVANRIISTVRQISPEHFYPEAHLPEQAAW